MRLTLLVNPLARRGRARAVAQRAARALRDGGLEVIELHPRDRGEAAAMLRDVAAEAEPTVDAVVVVGGDGTVHLALQVLGGTALPLGIVPAGTGNDTVALAGTGRTDPREAVEAIAAGRSRRVDLGRIDRADGGSAQFGAVLACGFDARVNERANRLRWPRGRARYTVAILIEFLRLRATEFTLELEHADGSVTREQRPLVMVSVGNGPTYGGGIPVCPAADPADGVLDVTLVAPAGRLRLLRLLPRLYRGDHVHAPEVTTHRVVSVGISAPPGESGYADGERIGPLPLRVTVTPGALRVLSPQRRISTRS